MKGNLKKEIVNAFKEETPDLKSKIQKECENQIQYPAIQTKNNKSPVKWLKAVASVAACSVMFIGGLIVGYIAPKSQVVAQTETLVYLDVNPSIELSLDEDNRILSAEAINTDAQVILEGLELDGVGMITGLNAIVGSMYFNGYLSEENNSMLISVDTNDPNNTQNMLSHITEEVNEVFGKKDMKCSIIAQGVKVNEDLKRRAKERGISVGKMHLVDKMIDSMEELNQDDIIDLSKMSIKELNLIYSSKPNGGNAPNDELISGSVNMNVTPEQVLSAIKEHLSVSEVKDFRIAVLPSKIVGIGIVYSVTVTLEDSSVYKCEVDCKTGEVLSSEKLNIPPNGGPIDDGKHDDRQDQGPRL
ncbi:MAG: PepSY domain-containing protein [Clostridia bacterium]|nr:PepSY domain-containing protein [Clostridia bacterium]